MLYKGRSCRDLQSRIRTIGLTRPSGHMTAPSKSEAVTTPLSLLSFIWGCQTRSRRIHRTFRSSMIFAILFCSGQEPHRKLEWAQRLTTSQRNAPNHPWTRVRRRNYGDVPRMIRTAGASSFCSTSLKIHFVQPAYFKI